jgi:hypothetical protein
VARERGELGGVASLLDAFADSQPEQPAWRIGAMLSRAESDEDLDPARETLATWAADEFSVLPDNGFWLPNMMLLSDVAADLGAGDEARVLFRLLLPYRERFGVVSRILVMLGTIEHALARLATTTGDLDAARAHVDRARAKHAALAAPLLCARTDLADIALRRARGDVEGARALASTVAAEADRHSWPDVLARARRALDA